MKRFLIILSILFTVLLTIFACKKVNLLAPTYIPEETKFRVPANNQTIPSKIDVNPQPAKNGEVFGGFIRKFQYKGEWYVLATNKYYYDATNKILTEKGKQFLLKFDKNGNLSVLNSGKPINNNIWNHLTNFNIIETNQVWWQDPDILKKPYKLTNYRLYNGGSYYYYYEIAIMSNWLSYHSGDLLNWRTNSGKNIIINFPTNKDWQGDGWEYGSYWNYAYIYFKGKLYVFGGGKNNFTKNQDASITKYKVIDLNANGQDMNNWNFYNYPWGKESYIQVFANKNKLYIKRLGYHYWKGDKPKLWIAVNEKYDSSRQDIYSTTGEIKDGNIVWVKENNISSDIKFYGLSIPLITNVHFKPHPTNSNPPDWVFDKDNKRYYKAATNYSDILFNGKHYSLPIPPVNEIKKAADSGKTNFVITEEHIENSGKNQFMVSLVNPDNAKESDWKLITPLEYTGYSMIWQIGGGNTLFNINGKTIQLLDYCEMQNFLNYNNSAYNPIINELRRKAKTERSKSQYYNAMYYEAQADILEAILKNGGYIEPSESITHYEIEFRYR